MCRAEIEMQVENGLVGTAGEEWCEMNWESSTDIYTLPCVKQPASGKPLLGGCLVGSRRRGYMYSCLENSMDRGAWLVTAHWVTESHMTECLTLSHG